MVPLSMSIFLLKKAMTDPYFYSLFELEIRILLQTQSLRGFSSAQALDYLNKKIGQRLSCFRLRHSLFSNLDGRQNALEFFYFDES